MTSFHADLRIERFDEHRTAFSVSNEAIGRMIEFKQQYDKLTEQARLLDDALENSTTGFMEQLEEELRLKNIMIAALEEHVFSFEALMRDRQQA